MVRKEAESKLVQLTAKLEIPIGKTRNVSWLLKHLGDRNSEHKLYEETMQLCNFLKSQGWT